MIFKYYILKYFYRNPTPAEMRSPINNKTFTWKKSNDGNSSDFSYLYLGREVDNKVNFRQNYMKFWTQCFRCLAPSKYETERNKLIFPCVTGRDICSDL